MELEQVDVVAKYGIWGGGVTRQNQEFFLMNVFLRGAFQDSVIPVGGNWLLPTTRATSMPRSLFTITQPKPKPPE